MKLSIFFILFVVGCNYSYSASIICDHQEFDETRFGPNENDTGPIVISLGFNCIPAIMLRKNGVRYVAFPFDWIRTSFAGLCKILECSFADFINPDYFSLHSTFVLNTKYNIAFMHDFPTYCGDYGIDYIVPNYLEFLPMFIAKYQRRIERFYRILNSQQKIYLFRISSSSWNYDTQPQTQNEIMKLRDIVLSKFPQADFTLVALDTDPIYRDDWDMYKIRNFYLSDQTSEVEWKEIFHSLELI